MSKSYLIEPTRETLHGTFSKEYKPVIEIDSGDSVVFSTLDAGWGTGPRPSTDVDLPRYEHRDPESDKGHALCGPVWVRGAKPGMTLGVRINDVVPGSWGWNVAGGWKSQTNTRLGVDQEGEKLFVDWDVDVLKGVATNRFGHKVALNPFMGLMGMPPAEPGVHSTTPPRAYGGNMDCKELIPGTTLYLTIPVEGGLFSVGDGHAAQGDGEVSGVAIECPMKKVDLTFTVQDDMPLSLPRAVTPTAKIAFGFHEDLNEAMYLALDNMLNWMQEIYQMDRREALALASVVVDLRVTQIVNQVKGVHAMLLHGAIR